MTTAKDEAQRFWSKVRIPEDPDGCWLWVGSPGANGYGRFHVERRGVRAHRYSYQLLVGPIPDGLVLDHLCRNHACVNPAHLEPVTQRENILRGVSPFAEKAQRTHCLNGHPFDEANTIWRRNPTRRQCRICQALRNREGTQRRREARNAARALEAM